MIAQNLAVQRGQ